MTTAIAATAMPKIIHRRWPGFGAAPGIDGCEPAAMGDALGFVPTGATDIGVEGGMEDDARPGHEAGAFAIDAEPGDDVPASGALPERISSRSVSNSSASAWADS
jgi:hypothetical protein